MVFKRWSPMEEFARLRDEMARLLENQTLPALMGGEFQPAVDGYYEGNDLVIKADVPGFAPEDMDVRVYPESIVIKGEAKAEQAEERKGLFYKERRVAGFQRELTLPVQVIPEDAQATFRNGILEVRVPCARANGGQGHQVEIKRA